MPAHTGVNYIRHVPLTYLSEWTAHSHTEGVVQRVCGVGGVASHVCYSSNPCLLLTVLQQVQQEPCICLSVSQFSQSMLPTQIYTNASCGACSEC